MKNRNPLFIDSTKAMGTKKITSVEVTQLCLKEGEVLYFEVYESNGQSQKVQLSPVETKKNLKYKTEVWLPSNEVLEYRFYIINAEKKKVVTPFKQSSGGKDITEVWTSFELETLQKATKPVRQTLTKTENLKNEDSKKPREGLTLSPRLQDLLSEEVKQLVRDLSN